MSKLNSYSSRSHFFKTALQCHNTNKMHLSNKNICYNILTKNYHSSHLFSSFVFDVIFAVSFQHQPDHCQLMSIPLHSDSETSYMYE